jgi:tetratricopeptide (TPR) repeat protein
MNWEKLEPLLESGFKIYPDYEPLLHLEAQMEFDKGNFKKSKNLCLKLLKLNSKYIKIVVLLSDCLDELGEHDLANQYRDKLRTKLNN